MKNKPIEERGRMQLARLTEFYQVALAHKPFKRLGTGIEMRVSLHVDHEKPEAHFTFRVKGSVRQNRIKFWDGRVRRLWKRIKPLEKELFKEIDASPRKCWIQNGAAKGRIYRRVMFFDFSDFPKDISARIKKLQETQKVCRALYSLKTDLEIIREAGYGVDFASFWKKGAKKTRSEEPILKLRSAKKLGRESQRLAGRVVRDLGLPNATHVFSL